MTIREAVHGGLTVGLQMGLVVGVRLYEPDGVFMEEVVQPAHSFVLQWPTLLNIHLGKREGSDQILDTGNTLRSISTSTGNYVFPRVNAAIASGASGILLGTGTNAVAMTDYALQTQIAQGTGAGQLSHGLCATYPVDTAGANPRYVNIARGFQNNSGGSIAVAEVALYGLDSRISPGPQTYCLCRDLLSFTIGVGQLAIVQYSLVFNLT